MDEAEPKLKVTDRRHFTADGERKAEVTPPAPATDTGPPPVPPAAAAAAPAPADVTFASFIVSIATQAAECLGADPRDLGAARQMISVLEMLKDKTEGRRTEDESRILDAVLFDLRLAFVGTAKGSSS